MQVRAARAIRTGLMAAFAITVLSACPTPPPDLSPEEQLIAKGRELFFNETFAGNGRTCGSCHPADNNFTIDAEFIATLPPDDPLFVAEFNPDLAQNFENPRLMRQFGLILENLDGFGDLENKFVHRGVPHTLALRTSVASPQGPRTGWSGDGAPLDGSLRSFAVGAVIQHFTLTLNRIPGVDFRLPTEEELNALELFMLSLGRQEELTLPLALKDVKARRGQEIFMDPTLGKCALCHTNAGANALIAGNDLGNANFDTGVEDLPDQPIDEIGERVPPDDGFETPGDNTFNTPPLVEAADTGPFFHNNSVDTIEGAVSFYDGDSFNESPAGRLLASMDPEGASIEIDATQVVAIAAFLRVINALDSLQSSMLLLQGQSLVFATTGDRDMQLKVAEAEIRDAIDVLAEGNLHPDAVSLLREAKRKTKKAHKSRFSRDKLASEALELLEQARALLIET
jgi:mono/diheme cytochrome c family protein